MENCFLRKENYSQKIKLYYCEGFGSIRRCTVIAV